MLALRLPNWVGDVVMALPAIDLLHRRGLPLTLFGKRWCADLLTGTGLDVRPLPKGIFAAADAVRACGARRGVLFTNSFGSALQWRLAGAPAMGHRADGRSLLLGRGLSRPGAMHEVAAFHRLASAAAAWCGRPRDEPVPDRLVLPLAERHRAEAAAALAAAGVTGPYRVIAPLATGLIGGKPKVWPSFPLLCRMLGSVDCTLVACPGPGEEAALRAVAPGAVQLPGLGLGAYAAVCAKAVAVVANDSGPMHLAAAVGVPVVGVFGLTDPARTRPWSPQGVAVGSRAGWPPVKEVWDVLAALAPFRAG
jgi:heptosyltransferase-2